MTRHQRYGTQSNLNDALGKMVGRIDKGAASRLIQVKVYQAWQAVAGDAVASHTSGAHLRSGELVVLVDSPLWATELSALSGHYRTAMNEQLGKEAVRTVRFSVSRKVIEERAEQDRAEDEEGFYREDVVESVPLTAQERAQVEASAEAIPDADLREAVVRATVADLEWKKGLAARKSPQKPPEGP